MEEFLNQLYNYEHFGFYLILAIIILIVLFLLILFFGKKDKKEREIEATKKLQQINGDFVEEENVEEEVKEETFEDTIVMPSVDDMPLMNSVTDNNEIPEPILPEELMESVQEVAEEVNEIDTFDFSEQEIKIEEEEEQPILDRVEERDLVLGNTNVFASAFIEEEPKEEIKEEISVPDFNFEEIKKEVEETKVEKPISRGPQIFSSVYVPEKKVEVETPVVEPEVEEDDEELEFELPTLKSSVKKEEPVVEEIQEKQPSEEVSDEIELPTLTDYNLDELSGEVYTIKR